MNIGLTLSGGGALGLAHIGAIKALEELKVPISHISGTSIGSIIGSIYSAHLDTDKVIQFFRDIDYKRFIRFRIPTLGLIDLNMLKPLLVKYLPNDDFRELKIPMYICVTNLNTGRYEIKSDGKLIDWIITSSSVPFIFKPQLIDGFYYSDGGIVNNLPVSAIRDLCDHIIAIDLRPRENIDKQNFKSYRNVLYRTIQISMYHNNRKEIKKCDLYVEMNGINQFSIFDFKNIEKLVEFGYHVMMSKKQELMNLLNSQDQSEESFNKV